LWATFLPERNYLCFRNFDLALSLLGALFLLERSCLCFRDFDLAPDLLGVLFLSERPCLRFRDFDLALSLLRASFLPKCPCLRFRDFDLALSLLGGFVPFGMLFFMPPQFSLSPLHFAGFQTLPVVLWSQWAIIELDLPTTLHVLAFSLSNANLTMLDISMCV
jgi:hypothetical protein